MLLEEVDDATGRADEHVDAILENAALLFVVDTTEGQAERQPGVLAEQFGILVDLHGQFTRGRHDEGARGTGRL